MFYENKVLLGKTSRERERVRKKENDLNSKGLVKCVPQHSFVEPSNHRISRCRDVLRPSFCKNLRIDGTSILAKPLTSSRTPSLCRVALMLFLEFSIFYETLR